MVSLISLPEGDATSAPEIAQNGPEAKDRCLLGRCANFLQSCPFSLRRSLWTRYLVQAVQRGGPNCLTEAVKMDEQEGPKREADRQKKEADELEAVRQKNQKTFLP